MNANPLSWNLMSLPRPYTACLIKPEDSCKFRNERCKLSQAAIVGPLCYNKSVHFIQLCCERDVT